MGLFERQSCSCSDTFSRKRSAWGPGECFCGTGAHVFMRLIGQNTGAGPRKCSHPFLQHFFDTQLSQDLQHLTAKAEPGPTYNGQQLFADQSLRKLPGYD